MFVLCQSRSPLLLSVPVGAAARAAFAFCVPLFLSFTCGMLGMGRTYQIGKTFIVRYGHRACVAIPRSHMSLFPHYITVSAPPFSRPSPACRKRRSSEASVDLKQDLVHLSFFLPREIHAIGTGAPYSHVASLLDRHMSCSCLSRGYTRYRHRAISRYEGYSQ